MTTGTLTLPAFLLARIAEDERVARDVLDCEPWDGHEVETGWRASAHYPVENDTGAVGLPPARVLAECEAKRRIVNEYRQFVELDLDGIPQFADDTPEDRLWPEYGGGMFSGLRTVLRLLALPYADLPDFRDEWRL